MIHPDTEIRFVDAKVGLGVFATRLIRRGTITWILDDLDIRLSDSRVRSLDLLRRGTVLKYAYLDVDGSYVLCWDHARFVNHSFRPNMTPTPYGFELAARDIRPGEELRADYGTTGTSVSFECAPEEGTFRTRLMPDDHVYARARWDDMTREAFKDFDLVDQPLRHLIRPEFVHKVSAIAAGRVAPDPLVVLPGDG